VGRVTGFRLSLPPADFYRQKVRRQQLKEWDLNTYFSWQYAIIQAKLESTTKLVCLTIGCHMAMDGSGCFPSYARIAEESGLNRITVIRHVQKAADAGLLSVEERFVVGASGHTENTSNQYRATMPMVVAQGYHPSCTEQPPLVAQGYPNYSSLTTQLTNTPVVPKSTSKVKQSESFKAFWEQYPLKVGKPKALLSWTAQRCDDCAPEVLAGLERWKATSKWRRDGGRYVTYPTTWLNQRRWEDNPEPERPKPAYNTTTGEIPFQKEHAMNIQTPSQKIAELFKAFTGRFGILELKDGQSLAYVTKSWENSVGQYAWSDIQLAMRICFAGARWTRWPEEGQFMRSFARCSV
jgi:hypothetical protein